MYIVDPRRPWGIPSEALAQARYARTSSRRSLGDGSDGSGIDWTNVITSVAQSGAQVASVAVAPSMSPQIIVNPATGLQYLYNPATGSLSNVSTGFLGLSGTQLLLIGALLLSVAMMAGGRR